MTPARSPVGVSPTVDTDLWRQDRCWAGLARRDRGWAGTSASGSGPGLQDPPGPAGLGRYQQVYESPRAVLRAIGVEVREMPRNRAASFCCGAGGGRIWAMDEARTGDAGRPAEQRLLEALAGPGVTVFVVACPKDASMFTAALATLGVGDRLALRELSELVAEALQPGADERAA